MPQQFCFRRERTFGVDDEDIDYFIFGESVGGLCLLEEHSILVRVVIESGEARADGSGDLVGGGGCLSLDQRTDQDLRGDVHVQERIQLAYLSTDLLGCLQQLNCVLALVARR